MRLPRWLRFAGIWVLLMIVCGPQTIWSGAALSWSQVFWIQLFYWTTWAVLAPGIFWLCGWLYHGPRSWKRYVVGMALGALSVSILQPLIENVLHGLKEWSDWWLSLGPKPTVDFWSKVGRSLLKGSGTNPFMFAVIAIVWHAL